jgi:hypothetical protein
MSNLTTINQLVEKFNIKDFAFKTIQQINKDLQGLSSINVEHKETNDYLDVITNQLINVISELENNHQLHQFIYKVDVPEQQWHLFLSTQDKIVLAHQIIIREAQKVYLRAFFKS